MATITHEEHRYTERDRHSADGRAFSDLLRELRNESITLFRQEIQLAQTEMTEKAQRVGRNVGYLAIGGMVACIGAGLLLLTVVFGLYAGLVAMDMSPFIAGWLSPLIVGGVITAVGYGLVQKAISTLSNETAVPERTVQSLEEDRDWMKEKVSR